MLSHTGATGAADIETFTVTMITVDYKNAQPSRFACLCLLCLWHAANIDLYTVIPSDGMC